MDTTDRLTLSLAMVTHQEAGIKRVVAMNLPHVDGVRYVVSWQNSEGIKLPNELYREDMEIVRTPSQGVSNNRNNAVSRCKGDIILHADDDLKYTPEQLLAVIDTFQKHPEVDLAAFRYDGQDDLKFPEEECSLKQLPKCFPFTNFTLAVRRKSVLRRLYFDNRLGIGAPYTGCGEEDFYLYQARKMGMNCRFFPITITTHLGQTTGFRKVTDIKILRGFGAIIRVEYPRTSLLRVVLKVWRLWRGGQCANPFFALKGVMQGWIFGAQLQKGVCHE
jgi:glycosyltransferase involved in cell wall biosynthesis